MNNECTDSKTNSPSAAWQIRDVEKQREKMAALGQLAGGISHDFNNQLMSIIGNATMIRRTDDIEKIHKYAERIIHISQSAANLTKKILMFSRNESTTNELINLKDIMDDMLIVIESVLDKRIDMNYSFYASNRMIMGNESQIENVIMNLIINSRDAMAETGGSINVWSEDVVVNEGTSTSHGEVMEAGHYIMVSVEDTGTGMDEETMKRMFEPYFTTKPVSKGTGLGLSVVFGTVKSHSGYINVLSELGKGTRIEMYFPAVDDSQILDRTSFGDMDEEEDDNHIMLVDDDINVLNVEAELFEDLGYNVEKFSSSTKALKYYESNADSIRFAVLDMIMPEMGGKELYERMLSIKNTEVIFISGYSNQHDYEELVKQGIIFIEKPFTFEQLSETMARLPF